MKKGMSGIIALILIILISVIFFAVLYSALSGFLTKNSGKINSFAVSSVIIDGNKGIINKGRGILMIKIKNLNEELTNLKIVLNGENKNLAFNITELPKPLETKTYSLNISDEFNFREIIFYPEINGKKINGNIEKITYIDGEVFESNIINPLNEINGCNPSIKCDNFSDCFVLYNLDNLVSKELVLSAEMKRKCIDENNCIMPFYEKIECNNSKKIRIEKIESNGTFFAEIFDGEKKISTLEIISGKNNILNIKIPLDN